MPRLFRIKICGITRPDDAIAVGQAGGDAIGLNFCATSPRFVDDRRAETIAAACPSGLQKVGVFVNEPPEQIRRRAVALALDWIQLHGDEPPETIAQLAGLRVIRAFRLRDQRLQPVQSYLHQCRAAGALPDAVLLDAWHAEQYGGTGATLDWDALRTDIDQFIDLPWILAGGLRSTNVGAAIEQLRPDAVDTASGVESAPGLKDAQEIERFVQAARQAGGWD